MKKIVLLTVVILATGCQIFNPKPVAPDGFIVTTTGEYDVQSNLATFNTKDAYVVRFNNGSSDLSEKEQTKLLAWLSQEQPTMIAVQGSAGPIKYLELGQARSSSVITAATTKTDIVTIDYNEKLAGGRAYVYLISPPIEQNIRELAPIDIIYRP